MVIEWRARGELQLLTATHTGRLVRGCVRRLEQPNPTGGPVSYRDSWVGCAWEPGASWGDAVRSPRRRRVVYDDPHTARAGVEALACARLGADAPA